MTTLAPDTTFGKYRIIRLLGQGGMADVYEAEDTRIGRKVALKLLPESFARDEERKERFEKEIRASAALDHPNIVSVFDVGDIDGLTYYTMSLLPSGDLKHRIEKGALPPVEALRVVGDVSLALDFAHGHGFVHRDVKPENILFGEDGRAILTDFGIARAMGSDTRMTAAGLSIGTPHYMSPEQARGVELDGRADLYALGAVLHECLTGRTPYEAQDSFAIGMRHISDPIPVLPEGFAAVQPLLDRLMAKSPDDRYQTGKEVKAALDAIDPSGLQPPQVRQGTRVMGAVDVSAADGDSNPKPKKAPKALLWSLGGAVLASVFVVGVLFFKEDRAPSRGVVGGASTAITPSAPSGQESPSGGLSDLVAPGNQNVAKTCDLAARERESLQSALASGEINVLMASVESLETRFPGSEACRYAGDDRSILVKTFQQISTEHGETVGMQRALDRALETAEADVERLSALARLSDITDDQQTRQQAEETLGDAEQSISRIRERKTLVDQYADKLERSLQILSQAGIQ